MQNFSYTIFTSENQYITDSQIVFTQKQNQNIKQINDIIRCKIQLDLSSILFLNFTENINIEMFCGREY